MGSRTETVVSPGDDVIVTEPPCARTMASTMESPSPVLASAVVRDGSPRTKRSSACPYPWAVATRNALLRAGVAVNLQTYPGERHTFTRDWALSMRRTVNFLRSEMGVTPTDSPNQ